MANSQITKEDLIIKQYDELISYIESETGYKFTDKQKILIYKESFKSPIVMSFSKIGIPFDTINKVFEKRESIRKRIISNFFFQRLSNLIDKYNYLDMDISINNSDNTYYIFLLKRRKYTGEYSFFMPLWDDMNYHKMTQNSYSLVSINQLFYFDSISGGGFSLYSYIDMEIPIILVENNIHKAFLHIKENVSAPFLEFCTNSKNRVNIDNINFLDKITEYKYFCGNDDLFILCKFNTKDGFIYYE